VESGLLWIERCISTMKGLILVDWEDIILNFLVKL
jgi:hypothetical protein